MAALDGRRVVVTRAREQGNELGALLSDLGAEVLFCPTIQILPPADCAPLDQALQQLHAYDWIVFTSRNAVEHVRARLTNDGDKPVNVRARIAAVGTATRDALSACGWRVDAMPERTIADAIPAALGDVNGRRVLLPRSDMARPELPAALRAGGAQVDDVVAYRTVASGGAPGLAIQIRNGGVDAITFASGSAVRAFAAWMTHATGFPALWDDDAHRPRIVVIGPVTALSAAELAIPVDAVASEQNAHGLARAVVECLSTQPPVNTL